MTLGWAVKGLAATVVATAVVLPIEARSGDIFAGGEIYATQCASCHGVEGAPIVAGTPDFTRGEGLMAPDIDLIATLKVGKALMPGFDHIISDRELLDVLAFCRTLQR